MRSIHFETQNNMVVVKLREFEGVGRAEWTTLDTMSVDVAENLLAQFKDTLDVARINDRDMQDQRKHALKQDAEKKRREIADIERELQKLEGLHVP